MIKDRTSIPEAASAAFADAPFRRIHPQLPVFRMESREGCIFYTPGRFAALELDDADKLEQSWKKELPLVDPFLNHLSGWILEQAQNTVASWKMQCEMTFAPECLTVHLGDACNLACSYCFTMPRTKPLLPLAVDEAAVRAAARLVAETCAREQKPFTLILTGGGEPALHWKELVHTVDITRAAAREHNIQWFGYIATNGVMPLDHARWLGKNMNRVGLSCDGPPDIQNSQRPLSGGSATARMIEQTAKAIRAEGASLEARATVTPGTLHRLADIVTYLHGVLDIRSIRLEPVFKNPDGNFAPRDAAVFVKHFLSARDLAESLGCSLFVSGVRPDEIHGSYCDIFINVLRLLPDGTASACFLSPVSSTGNGRALQIGYYDASSGKFVLQDDKIETFRKKAFQINGECAQCINAYHCDRSCPGECFLMESRGSEPCTGSKNEEAQFRCRTWRLLSEAWIRRAVDDATENDSGQLPPIHLPITGRESIGSLLADLPADINVDAVHDQWWKARQYYLLENRTMPSPVWARRGFEHDGATAWRHLRQAAENASANTPFACYIHIPFCGGRCGFCDCYTLHPGGRMAHLEARYLEALIAEMDAWAGISALAQRPVSTVHFGGGTPNCLRAASLERLVRHFQSRFNTTPQTEWGLESTSRLLTADHLRQLRLLGFTRLHVGVQTLEEPLRRLIGRREASDVVARRIKEARDAGFITSVDLICGLPGQTADGFLKSVERLLALGIHGASLYRLNVSARNRRFLKTAAGFSPDALADYVLFHAAHQLFVKSGYRKNHFCHFSLPPDQNLYYTHAARGEDLLALGASSDGLFDGYRYRHPLYKPYVDGNRDGSPSLQGGVMETPLERMARNATVELMCGAIRKSTLAESGAESLAVRWLQAGLVEEDGDDPVFFLTASGSWLVNDMICEVEKASSLLCSREQGISPP